MSWTEQEVKETIAKIQSKASIDKAFRKKVLSNPEEAVREISGKDLPKGFRMKIIENAPGVDQTYVLPDFTGEELSDEQLDNVAGGRGCDTKSNCKDFLDM